MDTRNRENTTLLSVVVQRSRKGTLKLPCEVRRLLNHFCVSSKAARVVLLWNFSILLLYQWYSTTTLLKFNLTIFPVVFYNLTFSVVAVFAPLAGLLTDIKFSRYKAILCSSYGVLIQLLLIVILVVCGVLVSIKESFYDQFLKNPFIIVGYVCAIAFVITLIVFIINALQFGMDQLHNSPTDDSILFIHWYVWLYYVSSFMSQIPSSLLFYDSYSVGYLDTIRTLGIISLSLFPVLVFSSLVFALTVVRYKKVWFYIEPAGANPYKLVYKVVKFACQHKVPLRRSAFTYCEDELPSRMDLGKQKYGGPFSTKEVEDVKAFGGIFKVFICTGPAFMLQATIEIAFLGFAQHNTMYFLNVTGGNLHEVHPEGPWRHIFISNGLLSPLLVAICIPLYLTVLRPRISFHIPGMFKRIGLGIALMILSLAIYLAMEVTVHFRQEQLGCIFAGYTTRKNMILSDLAPPPLYLNAYFLTIQNALSALVNMLIDIAVFEFICSQSPYSMKGLLLGSFLSVKSLYQGVAIILIVPFGVAWKHNEHLSCGSGFCLMNIVIGLLELVLFSFVAKKYKYRTVNEPSNEYRYAEDYYSNIQ